VVLAVQSPVEERGRSCICDVLDCLFVEIENGIERNEILGQPASPVQTGPSSNGASWQSCRKLIIVPRSAQKGYTVGHWPIPESFWPDMNNDTLVSVELFCTAFACTFIIAQRCRYNTKFLTLLAYYAMQVL